MTTPTTPVLPSLPEITQDELEFLTYNPNTSDLVEWIQGYARRAIESLSRVPIDMVLHCPKCGAQHIDGPESLTFGNVPRIGDWHNPPHRSHLCHGCGHIWRPADVPTNGVAAVKTTGKADSPIACHSTESAGPAPAEIVRTLVEALRALVDREFTFFCGEMLGASRKITRDEVLAARAAIAAATGESHE